MSKLSLKLRKDIQDSEAKRNDALEQLKAASGETWELDLDWNAIYDASVAAKLGNDQLDRLGGTFTYVAESVISHLKNLCKDDIAKDTILDEIDKKKIRFVYNKDAKLKSGYFQSSLQDGVLVITTRGIANVSEAGNDIFKILGQKPGALPLKFRQYIRDEENKRNQHAEIIKEALGAEYTFDLDWAALFTANADTSENAWRMPQTLSAYTEAVANKLRNIGKDDMAKEQFLEETPKRTIKFVIDKKAKFPSGYSKESLQDGVLVFTIRDFANVSETGNGLLALLGNGPDQIPLKVRMNIRDNDAKRQEKLEKAREATGIPDLEWEFDWMVLFTAVIKSGDKSNVERIGDTYDAICKEAVARLERLCKDDMVKEAIVDALSAKKIRFVYNKDAKLPRGYHKSSFEDGVLVFTTRTFANISEIGNDIESLL